MKNHIEIERKFLIEYPNEQLLISQNDVRCINIVQTYLKSDDNSCKRVRMIEENGKKTYIKTEKIRISDKSCHEYEKEITYSEYTAELKKKDENLFAIEKRRIFFPYKNHIIEIDLYPYSDKRAILEAELDSEDEELLIPEFVNTIKEVTFDKRYKNYSFAKDMGKILKIGENI